MSGKETLSLTFNPNFISLLVLGMGAYHKEVMLPFKVLVKDMMCGKEDDRLVLPSHTHILD